MGLILLLLLVCLIFAGGVFLAPGRSYTIKDRFRKASGPFITSTLVCFGFVCIIWFWSYSNTVDMRQRLVNIRAYETTIESYIELSGEVKASSQLEVTDMKYQSYQKQIADLLRDLRKEVVVYNTDFIGKTEYKQNPFWSWVIFSPPPGSEILNMYDYIR